MISFVRVCGRPNNGTPNVHVLILDSVTMLPHMAKEILQKWLN